MKERLRQGLVLVWVLIVVGIAGLAIWYVLRGGPAEDWSNRAQFASALLSFAILVPPVLVWGWRHRRAEVAISTRAQVDAAADLLAAKTLPTWSEQLVRRGIELPAPVRVHWQWAASDVTPPPQDLAASPSLATDPRSLPSGADDPSGTAPLLSSGLVNQLHDRLYALLPHGRLALIGGPGAGKTAAMMLLLVEALRYRERIPDATGAEVPVPVWLTLGSWNPGSQGLRDWVTATIRRNHPYVRAADFGPEATDQFFDGGRIALFLDGMDEMPDTQRGQALERLTAEAAGLRVVITSRPEELRATLSAGRQLPYTAVVELQPVDMQAAVQYLLEGQLGVSRQRWHDVADHLLAHPSGALARTLDMPLTLSLARSVYTVGNPCELLASELDDEQALRGHLLDQVMVVAYPDPGERAHATYWLGWLAHHMNTQPNGPTRDLSWWRIPGWISRLQLGLVGGLLGGLVGGLVMGLEWLGLELRLLALVGGLVGGLVFGLVTGLGVRAVAPRSMTIRRPTRRDLGRGHWAGLRIGLWVGLLVGLVVGLTEGLSYWGSYGLLVWLVYGLWPGLVHGLVFALVAWLVFALVAWLVDVWRTPLVATLDATPRSVYQRDVRSQLVGGLMGVLACLLGFGLLWPLLEFGVAATGLTMAQYEGLDFYELLEALPVALAVGLMFGPLVGLLFVLKGGAAPSLVLAEIALLLKGRRVRFMPMLETALARQVLRQAGAVYQFRHADLQDRLADQYQARPTRHRPA